jgi:Rrf2 family transcriptional regulator, nitric oxide-sensitive transcriptional repressor
MSLKVMAHKRAGELTSAKEIVELTGCPFDATARVLQQMAQKEILRSEQGAHGGYVLIRDLSKISIFDLMEVILGPIAVARCLQDGPDCDLKAKCNIVSPVATFNRRLTDFYQDLSIGEILRIKEAPQETEAHR